MSNVNGFRAEQLESARRASRFDADDMVKVPGREIGGEPSGTPGRIGVL